MSRPPTGGRLVQGLVALAMLVSLLAAGLLVWARLPAAELLDDSPLVTLKEGYYANPEASHLPLEIRRVDTALRSGWERARVVEVGAFWALVAGLTALVWLWRMAVVQKLPEPGTAALRSEATGRARQGRWWGAVVVLSLAAGTVALGGLLSSEPGEDGHATAAATVPWPQFRGPQGSGIADPGDYVTQWQLEGGKNVLWRVPVSLVGHGSPVVTDRLVCLSGVAGEEPGVACFQREDGRLAWQGRVDAPAAADEDPFTGPDTGWAAPTPVVAGGHLFAVFGTGHAGAFDLAGRLRWTAHLGVLETAYGFASSPVSDGQNVFLQLDQLPDRASALYAVNLQSGALAWKVMRPVANSWATPLLISSPRDQLITAANSLVISYDPSRGQELWRADVLGGDVAPSPVMAGDLVLVIEPRRKLVALRTNGSGDVTETAVAWQHEGGVPDIPTPLATHEVVVLVSTTGRVHLLNPQNGSLRHKTRVKGEFKASPVLVGDHVYLVDAAGRAHIFDWRKGWEAVGGGDFGEAVTATPALAGGTIYVRTAGHLVALARQEGGR
jgi:outer membrane protein assembly factor BamB